MVSGEALVSRKCSQTWQELTRLRIQIPRELFGEWYYQYALFLETYYLRQLNKDASQIFITHSILK